MLVVEPTIVLFAWVIIRDDHEYFIQFFFFFGLTHVVNGHFISSEIRIDSLHKSCVLESSNIWLH